jgi:hypothetical protein
MKKLYVFPVITQSSSFPEYAILAGSPGSLRGNTAVSGVDNAPGNGGRNDGSHDPGAKIGYDYYNVWEK